MRVFKSEQPGNSRYTVGHFFNRDWYVSTLEAAGFEVQVRDNPARRPEPIEDTLRGLRSLEDVLEEVSRSWPSWRKDLISEALRRFLDDAKGYEELAKDDEKRFRELYGIPVYHLRCTRRAAPRPPN